MKSYNQRADNTVTTVYRRFMEHFWAWDKGSMENREWETIRRGFEAQGKILGNLVRVLVGTAKTPDEFRDMCIAFGIVPNEIKKLTDGKIRLVESDSKCPKCEGALIEDGSEKDKLKCFNCGKRVEKSEGNRNGEDL